MIMLMWKCFFFVKEYEDWLEDAKSRIKSSREQVTPHWLKLKQAQSVAQEHRYI